jgi:hypothetical protein
MIDARLPVRRMAIALLALAGPCTQAGAQAIADNMTCAQAVSYYERNGRIYKIANGKDVIPIYNGVPVSREPALHCEWGYMKAPYRTKTLDNRRCVISYRCVAAGWDR